MKQSALLVGFVLTASVAAAACSSGPDETLSPLSSEGPQSNPPNSAKAGSNDPRDPNVEALPDLLENLPTGTEQLSKVCARGQRDAVTKALCANPTLSSIEQLQEALGLGFDDRSATGDNGVNGNPGFALLGHSTSLVAREISAINPRAFVFTPPPGQPTRLPGYTVMGFARGEPFVEIAAEDPNSRKLTFYLFRFNIACEESHTCKPGDTLTPAIEKNWKGWSLYDDEDLKNSLADCRHCHQPGGPSTKPMLRMQELADPWTHWFRSDRPGGLALFQDFLRAHGDQEDYAGIPAAVLQKADGRAMEDLVRGQGFGAQPNLFDSEQIETEVLSSSSLQPQINNPMGKSSTWQRLYDASVAGQFIPPPYHDVKVTDPDKLAFVTDAYKKFSAGSLKATELPDIRRVFLDDALASLSFFPKQNATGKEVLVQTCAQCHNPRLDQSISRARFDITRLDTMSAADKANAINRLRLPTSNRLHMPPGLMRNLSDEARDAAIAELSK
jgi:cytochrome c553